MQLVLKGIVWDPNPNLKHWNLTSISNLNPSLIPNLKTLPTLTLHLSLGPNPKPKPKPWPIWCNPMQQLCHHFLLFSYTVHFWNISIHFHCWGSILWGCIKYSWYLSQNQYSSDPETILLYYTCTFYYCAALPSSQIQNSLRSPPGDIQSSQWARTTFYH